VEPTPELTPEPTAEPTPELTPEPTAEPAPEPTPDPDLVLGKPGTPYVVDAPPEFTGEWALTVILSTSGDGPTVTSLVTNGVGPYSFMFDCGNDGNWDPNGRADIPEPTASHTCPAGTSIIEAWVWDMGSGLVLSEIVSVGN
jgi:hypothetical protein